MMKYPICYISIILLVVTACTPKDSPPPEDEINAIENGLMTAVVEKGDSIQTYSLVERMKYYHVPGVSVAVVRDSKIRWAKGYGTANTNTGAKVDTGTLFQAGSISKPIAALAALKLSEEGRIDLDVNVNEYLVNWKVQENEYTRQEKVTIRRLLTHTAGTTVHGFPGYTQTDTYPSIQQVLKGEGNTAEIFVDTIPGSIWRYSGGGYTIMEKAVEDVSGMPLEQYIRTHILDPLQMTHSTYEQPLPEKYHHIASAAYDTEGKIIEGLWHNYPEQAAAGLWTTPVDLAKYCIEIQQILAGKSKGILKQEIVEAMLTKYKNDWGLGLSLVWDADSLRFQHGGKNAGFTNNMIAFAYSGDAVIIMTNADNGGKIISELLRSVSSYYGWGISDPRTVELSNISGEELEKYAGKYILEEQIPGISDYIVDVGIEGKKLVVFDPNNGERDELSAMDAYRFIDLEDGDKVTFRIDPDSVILIWNNQYHFYKMN